MLPAALVELAVLEVKVHELTSVRWLALVPRLCRPSVLVVEVELAARAVVSAVPVAVPVVLVAPVVAEAPVVETVLVEVVSEARRGRRHRCCRN